MNIIGLFQATTGTLMWQYDEPIYFWGHSNNYGFLSNWYPCSFKCGPVHLNCVEQYMMWRKAKVFNDLKTADAILCKKEPREHKFLGRQVANFNQDKWDSVKINIVLFGLCLKFSQNEVLYQKLMSTGKSYLVEASPCDNIWAGIGDTECMKLYNINCMPGQNLLGKCLCYLRDEIFGN